MLRSENCAFYSTLFSKSLFVTQALYKLRDDRVSRWVLWLFFCKCLRKTGDQSITLLVTTIKKSVIHGFETSMEKLYCGSTINIDFIKGSTSNFVSEGPKSEYRHFRWNETLNTHTDKFSQIHVLLKSSIFSVRILNYTKTISFFNTYRCDHVQLSYAQSKLLFLFFWCHVPSI